MKKILFLTLSLLGGCNEFITPNNPLCSYTDKTFLIGEGFLHTKIACSYKDKSVGLMNVENLGKDEGMIFVFNTPDIHGFWMKNTLVPLSIAFIDEQWNVVDIKEMQAKDETTINPVKPALYAIEANKNWFLQHNVHIGDKLRLKP